ncbi:MAG: hypothetical protein GXO64_00390 [Candidatus Micrarchaeota archaeon]|nr:hypothetical protein [Candidatus Micrarchaeota archaeon]
MDSERIKELLEDVLNDHGMPRTIRTALEESLATLGDEEDINVKLASIISALDEASGDPNISSYARTRIWNLMSELESMKQ